MKTTNHNRLFIVLCISLIFSLIYSACGTAATPMIIEATTQQPKVTQKPEIAEQPSANEPCVMNEDYSMFCTFPQEGEGTVRIELPGQGRRLTIEPMYFGDDLSGQLSRYGFKLLCPIININVIDPSDGSVVHDFEPSLTLTANYGIGDCEKAGIDSNQLFIVIYNHDTDQFQTYDSRIDPDFDTYINLSNSTGTITVTHLASQVYWAIPDSMIEVFPQEEGPDKVTLELPWQGRQLQFNRKNFDDDLDQPIPTDEYIRKIIYVQVIDPNINNSSNPDYVVHSFSPPLVMTAEYSDLEAMGYNPEELLIGIYDHDYNVFNDYKPQIDTSNLTGTIWIEKWTSHACWRR